MHRWANSTPFISKKVFFGSLHASIDLCLWLILPSQVLSENIFFSGPKETILSEEEETDNLDGLMIREEKSFALVNLLSSVQPDMKSLWNSCTKKLSWMKKSFLQIEGIACKAVLAWLFCYFPDTTELEGGGESSKSAGQDTREKNWCIIVLPV